MDIAKTSIGKKKGFNFRIILGVIFIFFGILVMIEMFNINFLRDEAIIGDSLKYGTALGSIIGGFFMLFRKKYTISNI